MLETRAELVEARHMPAFDKLRLRWKFEGITTNL